MKISKIEFENFRNFKEKCCITFPIDGSVTVIYGPNGVGKTTLHQLFQWIFYGEVHFNKTASKDIQHIHCPIADVGNQIDTIKLCGKGSNSGVSLRIDTDACNVDMLFGLFVGEANFLVFSKVCGEVRLLSACPS